MKNRMKCMMVMMLACCLGPTLLLWLTSSMGLKLNANIFPLICLGAIAVCFLMMRKGGGCCSGSHEKGDEHKENKQGCCH